MLPAQASLFHFLAEALTAAGPLKQARDQLIASGRTEDSIADVGSIHVRNMSRQSPVLPGRLKLGKWRQLVYSQSLQVCPVCLIAALRCLSLCGISHHLLTVTDWRMLMCGCRLKLPSSASL